MNPALDGRLRFGPFELNPSAMELRKLDRRIKLRPQACKVLALLASRPGEVVTREELRRLLWSDETFVDFEHGVNFCVRQIRAALGENPKSPRYIETIPRSGYRFISPRGPIIHSIAILPFENVAGDPNLEYLNDGITEGLTRQIALVPGLQVMARSTVFRFKGRNANPVEVGWKLGVGGVVTGRISERDGRLSIGAELVEVSSGLQLWCARYERTSQDILTVQSEIPNEISAKLRYRLTGQERKRLGEPWTESVEAYRLYLKGRYFWNKWSQTGFQQAIAYFRKALDADPVFALAYAGLADCYGPLGFYGYLPPTESWPKAKAAALKALEIDETVCEAHAAIGAAKVFFDWDWAGSLDACRRAIELNPNYHLAYQYYSFALLAQCRYPEAVQQARKARELDPLSAWSHVVIAICHHFAREYDAAVVELHKALELDPDFGEAHRYLGITLVQKGNAEQAISELLAAGPVGDTPAVLGSLARAYGLAGKKQEVEAIIGKLQAQAAQMRVAAASLAVAYLALGNKDMAFQWISQAVGNRSSWMAFLDADPWWDPLRSDPRFQVIRKRVGLPERD